MDRSLEVVLRGVQAHARPGRRGHGAGGAAGRRDRRGVSGSAAVHSSSNPGDSGSSFRAQITPIASTLVSCKRRSGVMCPRCGDDLVERRSKRGRVFYGCGTYPTCDYALWDKPMVEPCPQCNGLVALTTRGKPVLRVPSAAWSELRSKLHESWSPPIEPRRVSAGGP